MFNVVEIIIIELLYEKYLIWMTCNMYNIVLFLNMYAFWLDIA